MAIWGQFPEKDFPPAREIIRHEPVLPMSEDDWELARRIERDGLAAYHDGLAPVIAAHERSREVKEFIRLACAHKKLAAFV